MSLSIASSEQYELPSHAVSVDCACDGEKISAVRAYIERHFPDRAVRQFHSHSTVRQGAAAVPCADYHVVSISDERPCCAILTREFIELPVGPLDDCLRGWDLATALRVNSMVIVGRNGISPL
jgi:hypothetical protein